MEIQCVPVSQGLIMQYYFSISKVYVPKNYAGENACIIYFYNKSLPCRKVLVYYKKYERSTQLKPVFID
jgi:hypothetical protein